MDTPSAVTYKPGSLVKFNNRVEVQFVTFRIDQQVYALPLELVVRALRMVAINPIPDSPGWLRGVINIAGQIVPVIDLRVLFGLMAHEPNINDRLLITNNQDITFALMVDDVLDVLTLSPHQVEVSNSVISQSRPLKATLQQDDRLVLVLDPAYLLPLDPREVYGK